MVHVRFTAVLLSENSYNRPEQDKIQKEKEQELAENKRETGRRYEQMAAAFLEQQGYEILEMNYQGKYGEIDLIARHGKILVFAEVKYRKTLRLGYPEEAVGPKKQKRIYHTARYYLYSHGLADVPCRFDVVSILGTRIRLIQNAF